MVWVAVCSQALPLTLLLMAPQTKLLEKYQRENARAGGPSVGKRRRRNAVDSE
jgi:hypothetical protein